MSLAGKALGVRLTDTSTTLEHELGSVAFDTEGGRYRYVQAGEAIAAYTPVDYTAAWVASVTDANDKLDGVAQTAIAASSYGWIMESGEGIALSTADLADQATIDRITTTGGVINIVAADSGLPCGKTMEAEGATTDTYSAIRLF